MNELSIIVADAGAPVREHAPSLAELEAACEHGNDPEVRVVVLGPFNQGKSTLLNALLGTRALPVDIVRATAGPIVVRNGPTPETRIVLADGTQTTEPGFELLRKYCVADGNGAPRGQVREAEVRLPHPLLARGVALVDLPGTGDTPEHDEVIRHELLRADLVVQVLNARQLLTLDERRHLDDWVFAQGIEAVLFVVNFLNLLDGDDQEAAWTRAVGAAERLEVALPPGPRVLRVDALPALRAGGDTEAMERSGLIEFRDRLRAAIDDAGRRCDAYRLPRITRLARQVGTELAGACEELDRGARALRARREAEHSAAQARTRRLAQNLAGAAARARVALAPDALKQAFHASLASALEGRGFTAWRDGTLAPWLRAQTAAIDAVTGALAPTQPGAPFSAAIPPELSVTLPAAPNTDSGSVGASVAAGAAAGFVAGSIFPIVGHVVGPILGAFAGLGRAEQRKDEAAEARRRYLAAVEEAYRHAAAHWLEQLGKRATAAVDTRVAELTPVLEVKPSRRSLEEKELESRVAQLTDFAARLDAARVELLARAA